MPSGFLLSDHDKQVIREARDLLERIRANPQNKPASAYDLSDAPWGAPDVYVALTPSGGIPGRSEETTGTGTGPDFGDVPGSAVCNVWQLQNGEMQLSPAGSVDVFNFGGGSIAGNTWVLIARDKWGTWWPSGQVSGGGSGGIEVKDSTGAPDYAGISTLIFDHADGFTLTQPAAGQAEVHVVSAVFSGARVSTSNTTSVPSGVPTTLGASTVTAYDTDSYANASGFKIPANGYYRGWFEVGFTANIVGYRGIFVLNGAITLSQARVTTGPTSDSTLLCVPWDSHCAVNDIISVQAYQTSGGNLDVLLNRFAISRMGLT